LLSLLLQVDSETTWSKIVFTSTPLGGFRDHLV